MQNKSNGVSYYTAGYAAVTVFFPEDRICCGNCEFCYDDGLHRCWCRLTRKLVFDPWGGRPESCPLEIEEADDAKSGTV